MDSSHLRQFVVELLPKVGQTKSEPAGEAVLLRNGQCYGRHFQFSEVLAVWYEGQPHVTFYNHYGTPAVLNLGFEASEPRVPFSGSLGSSCF